MPGDLRISCGAYFILTVSQRHRGPLEMKNGEHSITKVSSDLSSKTVYLLYLDISWKGILSHHSNNFVCWFIVERRRRDKINNWIVQLSKTIPDCTLDSTKTGQVGFNWSGISLQVTDGAICFLFSCGLLQSKGGILSKACDYIQELRQSNNRIAEELNTLDRLRMDNQLLRQEVSLKYSFNFLRHVI